MTEETKTEVDLTAPVKKTSVSVGGRALPTVAELRAALSSLDPSARVSEMSLTAASLFAFPSWVVGVQTVVEQAPKP